MHEATARHPTGGNPTPSTTPTSISAQRDGLLVALDPTRWHDRWVTVRMDEGIVLPRNAVRFPLELRTPPGMQLHDPATWPAVDGRVEYVEGRLLFMPPCGDVQQDVATDVVYVLRSWSESHQDFIVAANEAGMLLAGDVRGADAAVWRTAQAGERTGKYRRTPPVLAVEVAGTDEGEQLLRDKARWYLSHGVQVVWLVLPDTFEVVVIDASSDERFDVASQLPVHPDLPGLAPRVGEIFAQIRR